MAESEHIELIESRDGPLTHPAGTSSWHGLFACQVNNLPYDQWGRLRWGFNAAALMDEALERYKIFIEAQYAVHPERRMDLPHQHTLALRAVSRPGIGLRLAICGKVPGPSQSAAEQEARRYCREIRSIFPQDYIVHPAKTREQFMDFSGSSLLDEIPNLQIAQIKRADTFLPSQSGVQYVHGLWQSSSRANEQIWRALAAMPQPILFSIMLRPTILYPHEQLALQEVKNPSETVSIPGPSYPVSYAGWMEAFVKRRLAPLKKFFYLQIHVASNPLDENIIRDIGATLTRDPTDQASPGYYSLPAEAGALGGWKESLQRLDFTPHHSAFSQPRLSDLADIDEVMSVFRYPFPPEAGLAGVQFIPPPRQEPNGEPAK